LAPESYSTCLSVICQIPYLNSSVRVGVGVEMVLNDDDDDDGVHGRGNPSLVSQALA
jgi:hypothetical protein